VLEIKEKKLQIEPLGQIQASAVQNRWDINQARIDVENKKFLYHARRNELLPLLDLTGGLSYTGIGDAQGTSYDSARSGNHPVWYTGFLFQMPLGNRRVRGAYLKAKQEYEIAELRVQKQEKEILVETTRVYRRVETSFKTIQASIKAENLQDRKLKLEEKKFKQGRSSIKTVIDFQDDLQNAQLRTLRSMIDYRLAVTRLDFTGGTLLEKTGVR